MWREDEEEASNHYMTLRKRKDTGNWNRSFRSHSAIKQLALEEATDLSKGRLSDDDDGHKKKKKDDSDITT